MNKNNQEIEIKIKVADPEALFAKALSLGGVEQKEKEGLERDVMYDDGKGFYDFPKVLRLRTTAHGNLITYKEKNADSDTSTYLVRTEIESHIDDAAAIDQIVRKLGFFPYRIKEKYRKEILLGDLVIEFHKMPFIGDYIEIEGEREDIKKILSNLDLHESDGINKDYSGLFYDFCEAHDLSKEIPMTFEEEKKHDLQK
jgi:predicted adenylyl cyclase CyaB